MVNNLSKVQRQWNWSDILATVVSVTIMLVIVFDVYQMTSLIIRSGRADIAARQTTVQKYQDQQKVYDGGQTIEWTLAGHTADGHKVWRARLVSELSIQAQNNKYDHWLYKTEQPDPVTINRVEPHPNGKWIEDVPVTTVK